MVMSFDRTHKTNNGHVGGVDTLERDVAMKTTEPLDTEAMLNDCLPEVANPTTQGVWDINRLHRVLKKC